MANGIETAIGAQVPDSSRGEQSHQRLVAAGGILGALAASSCCILPLVLFSLGISGAWIGAGEQTSMPSSRTRATGQELLRVANLI